ncbi:MAG: hypothetical protein Q9214_007693 [Letrouitia sp. 1 TL-2023]
MHLPLNVKPTQPHVPIWMSSNIKTAQRVIVYFGETHQDHGIFAWRLIEESVSSGTIIGFVKDAQGERSDNTAVVIANMGQLLWYRGGGRAVTLQTWNALPRAKGTDPPMLIDEAWNRVPGNETPAQHVKSIFEHVLPRFAKPDTRIQVLGTGDGAAEVVAYLEDTWEEWAAKVTAIAITTGPVWTGRDVEKENFKTFWSQRARAYVVSDEPVETPLTGREDFGCNVYSAGENAHVECTTPKAYKKILQFFKLVEDVPGYRELEAAPRLETTATDTDFRVIHEDQSWS